MRSFLLLLFLVPALASAQVLQPGDVAVVGLYHDGNDAFALVTLADVPGNTEIAFTENGWTAAGTFRGTGEGTMRWMTGETLAAGTVVTFACNGDQPTASMAASTGTVIEGSICGLSGSGDQILVYQGEADAPTFLYAVNNEGSEWQADATSSNTSALPAGLTDGVTAVALPELDNYAYTGPTSGTADELRAAIGNVANWAGDNDRTTVPAFPTSFDLSGAPVPLTVQFDVTTTSLPESNAPVRLLARLTEGAPEPVTVDVGFDSGTATADVDFSFSPATLTFAAGSDTASVTLILLDDDEDEGDETATLRLQNPSAGLTIGTADALVVTITDDGVATEYEVLFPGATAGALLDSLRRVYTPATLGYGPARQQMFGYVWNDGGKVEGLYTGLTVDVPANASDATSIAFGQDFNTEHAWPQSMGAENEPQRSNLFNLYPTNVGVNSDRGNLPFGEVADAQATDWYYLGTRQSTIPTTNIDAWSERGQGRFEPREHVKGDVARAQFYFYAIYAAVADRAYFDGVKATLRTWHDADTVSTTERLRHDRIVDVQGKANPFVLDSTLVRRAFFSGDIGDPTEPVDTLITMEMARQRGVGTVTVRGIVTRSKGAYTYFQDETGALVVRETSGDFYDLVQSGGLAPGDSLEVNGTLSTFNGLLQINGSDLASYTMLSRDNALPDPISLTVADIKTGGEPYESRLIRVAGLAFAEGGTFAPAKTYSATADGASIDVRIANAADTDLDGEAIPQAATFTGVLGQFSASDPAAGYQLMPIEVSDLTVVTATEQEAPAAFALYGISPHPVDAEGTLRFDLPQSASVEVSVFDVTGRRVQRVQREVSAGASVAFPLDTSALSPGVYLYRAVARLAAGEQQVSGRIVVVR